MSLRRFCLLLAAMSLACETQKSSDLKVTNGKVTEQFPSVVEIRHISGKCTGTFIRPHVLLTAAHCIEIDAPIVLPQFQVASAKITVHPAYTGTDLTNDLALVFFSGPVSDSVQLMNYKRPDAGSKVTLIGYGDNEFLPNGTQSRGSDSRKRIGVNTIREVSDQYITIKGVPYEKPELSVEPDGESVSAAHGDSGSPLLNEQGEIIGIASFVSRHEDDSIYSHYVHLGSHEEFIETQLRVNAKLEAHPFIADCHRYSETAELKILQDLKFPGSQELNCDRLYFALAQDRFLGLSGAAGKAFHGKVLKSLIWLRGLMISDYSLLSTDFFASLPHLEVLQLTRTQIQDLAVLATNLHLKFLMIDEAKEPSLELVQALPRLMMLKVNGTSRSTIREQVLSGTWIKACYQNEESTIDPARPVFAREIISYDSRTNLIAAEVSFYDDVACSHEPFAKLASKMSLEYFSAFDEKDVYAMDVVVPAESLVVIRDESFFSSDQLDLFKKFCPYALKTEMKCSLEIQPFDGNFTIIKIQGNTAYLGAVDDAGTFDGSSADKRFRAFQSQNFKRQ